MAEYLHFASNLLSNVALLRNNTESDEDNRSRASDFATEISKRYGNGFGPTAFAYVRRGKSEDDFRNNIEDFQQDNNFQGLLDNFIINAIQSAERENIVIETENLSKAIGTHFIFRGIPDKESRFASDEVLQSVAARGYESESSWDDEEEGEEEYTDEALFAETEKLLAKKLYAS